MVIVVCRGLHGAIRNPWQEQSRWQIALLFTRTISNAQWTVHGLSHSLVASMEAGSPQIYQGPSRANPTAMIGN
jgi:hypothetical protein